MIIRLPWYQLGTIPLPLPDSSSPSATSSPLRHRFTPPPVAANDAQAATAIVAALPPPPALGQGILRALPGTGSL